MMASTSSGAGIATVPLPQRPDILPVIGSTLGRPLLSVSFSRHDFRFAMAFLSLQRTQPNRVALVIDHPHLVIGVILDDQIVLVVERDFSRCSQRQLKHGIGTCFLQRSAVEEELIYVPLL